MSNNKPVAWKQTRAELNNEGDVIAQYTSIRFNTGWEELPNGTPLYVNPIKELTDEDINEIVWQQNLLLGNDDLRKFAKAILRKAQEK